MVPRKSDAGLTLTLARTCPSTVTGISVASGSLVSRIDVVLEAAAGGILGQPDLKFVPDLVVLPGPLHDLAGEMGVAGLRLGDCPVDAAGAIDDDLALGPRALVDVAQGDAVVIEQDVLMDVGRHLQLHLGELGWSKVTVIVARRGPR